MSYERKFQVDRNKSRNGHNIFKRSKKFNNDGLLLSKSDRLMEGIGVWASFYRSNPHRFVKEYLNIDLKIFQIILIYMMNVNHYFMYLASRGKLCRPI